MDKCASCFLDSCKKYETVQSRIDIWPDILHLVQSLDGSTDIERVRSPL